jgi:hypothetical protein
MLSGRSISFLLEQCSKFTNDEVVCCASHAKITYIPKLVSVLSESISFDNLNSPQTVPFTFRPVVAKFQQKCIVNYCLSGNCKHMIFSIIFQHGISVIDVTLLIGYTPLDEFCYNIVVFPPLKITLMNGTKLLNKCILFTRSKWCVASEVFVNYQLWKLTIVHKETTVSTMELFLATRISRNYAIFGCSIKNFSWIWK